MKISSVLLLSGLTGSSAFSLRSIPVEEAQNSRSLARESCIKTALAAGVEVKLPNINGCTLEGIIESVEKALNQTECNHVSSMKLWPRVDACDF